MKKQDFNNLLIALLAAHPEGLAAPALRAALKARGMAISQPTLSRRLLALRAQGLVLQTGKARATRYVFAGGRQRLTELRSRALHGKVAEKLALRPALKQEAIAQLERLRQLNPASAVYLERWRELLAGDELVLLRTMTEAGPQSDALRQASPFTTLLTETERKRIFDQFTTRETRKKSRGANTVS